jgi:hypothetical protein
MSSRSIIGTLWLELSLVSYPLRVYRISPSLYRSPQIAQIYNLLITSIESRIEVVFFLAIAGATQSLEVANIVATARCEGDNTIDR